MSKYLKRAFGRLKAKVRRVKDLIAAWFVPAKGGR